MTKITKTLLSGSVWTGLGEVFVGVSSAVAGILAARILAPHDFGLMKVVALAMMVLEHFSQTGFDSAIIQKKGDVDGYLDTAWTWQLLRGGLLAGVLCGAAPLLAMAYDEPLLTWLMITAAGGVLVRSGSNIGVLKFHRNLEFRKLFFIKMAQALLRVAVYIPAILWFQNVWALVISHVSACMAQTVVSYIAHPYRPKLRWDWEKLRQLIRFGKWLTGMSMIGYVIGQGDDWFVSGYLGITALGFYQLAYSVSNMPTTNITHVIGSVGFPTYALLQDDQAALRETFVKILRSTLLLSGAATVAIYAAIPDVVAHIIGNKWERTIPLVRILVISGFVRSFAALAGPLFQGTGRPDLDFKMNLPRFLVTVSLVYPLTKLWGLAGTSMVVLIAICTCLPVWFYGVRKLIDLGPIAVFKHTILPLLSSALLLGSIYALRPRFDETLLGAALAYGCSLTAWLAALWFLGRVSPYDLFGELRALRASVRKPAS